MMPLFRYEVIDKNGKTMSGVMNAPSEGAVQQKLHSTGYTVKIVVPSSQASSASRSSAVNASAPAGVKTSGLSAPQSELALFFRGLASFLQSGLTVFESMQQSAVHTRNHGMRVICERLAASVQNGSRLCDAMAEYPKAFPPHVIGVVTAGEVGGFLPLVAGDIALDYELVSRASSKWINWINKALWVNAIGTLIIAPFLPLMFSPGNESAMDGIKKYIIWTTPHVVLPIVVLLAIYYIIKHILSQPGMRYKASNLELKFPPTAGRSKHRSLASFTRILWHLQNAGILPIQAWDTASRAAENLVIASKLHDQLDEIKNGKKFSEVLSATGLFGGDDIRLMSLGERTGQVPDALQRTAAFYEDAAITSANKLRVQSIRLAVIVNVIALGVFIWAVEIKRMTDMFDWVDQYFGV